jgi:hypothetical protein
MADQYIALVEETDRGTDPGTGYMFLPVMGSLQPTFNPTDESRKEFKGADTALGDSSVVRRSSQWTYSLECAWYPGAETGLLFKHLMGYAITRAVADTTAYEGILYPLAAPYGDGRNLEDTAIGIVCNSDEEGTTKSRYYGGGRVKSCKISGAGTDDVKLVFELMGPGEFIGPFATATASPVFPVASPFLASDLLCYIGAGITRTGTAPNFTAILPNTMTAFRPDSIDLTITNGLDDKVIMNGILGPSKTTRTGQFAVELSAPIDYADPSSGFSSADEVNALIAGTHTNSVLIVADNGQVAGSVDATYSAVIDLPNLLANHETPTRTADGTAPSVNMKYKSLYSDTTDYPVAIFTTDKASAY